MPIEATARPNLSKRLQRIEKLLRRLLARTEAGEPRFLGIEAAAAFCGHSPTTVRTWLATGKLTGLRPATGRVVVDRRELVALVLSSTKRPHGGRGTYERAEQGGQG
jgi:hypothetical protein